MKIKLTLSIILITLFFIYEEGMAQAPGWAWAKSAGGSGYDIGSSIATDANGNTYVTGWFRDSTISFGGITLTNTHNGYGDIFIVKYDASGNVIWAKSAGGIGDDGGGSITIDANGSSLLTGGFSSPTITFGTTTLTNVSNMGTYQDIFILKLDTAGNILWAKSGGGAGGDNVYGIAVDANGNSYITGNYDSPAISFDSTTLISSGGADIFFVKYDASGNMIWAKNIGGNSSDGAHGIAVDALDNVYITGFFHSYSTIIFGNDTLTNSGGDDIFIAKYDSSGNVIWARSEGALDDCFSSGITVDLRGNVFITGYFQSTVFTIGSTTLTNVGVLGYADAFIAKYDSAGNPLWAKSGGGTDSDYGSSIAVDSSGGVYFAGTFLFSNITFGSITLSNAGGQDIFIVKYDSTGNLLWGKAVGGGDFDAGNIVVDGTGNPYLSGWFRSPSITFGSTNLTNSGYSDFFIAKLDNTTGIAEQTPNNNLTLYPNPVTDYITIKTGNNKKQVVTITDITGKIIYSTTTLSEKTIINTRDFAQGVFAVQVQAGDTVEMRKVIVVR